MSAEWLVGDRVRAEGLATQHPPTRVVDDVCCLGDVAVVAAAGVCALAQQARNAGLNRRKLAQRKVAHAHRVCRRIERAMRAVTRSSTIAGARTPVAGTQTTRQGGRLTRRLGKHW